MRDTNLELFVSAYKENEGTVHAVPDLLLLLPEPRNINIYTYDGELPANAPAGWTSLKSLDVVVSLSQPHIMKSIFCRSYY